MKEVNSYLPAKLLSFTDANMPKTQEDFIINKREKEMYALPHVISPLNHFVLIFTLYNGTLFSSKLVIIMKQ